MRPGTTSIGFGNGGALIVLIGLLVKRTGWCVPGTQKPVRVKTTLPAEIRNALRYFDMAALSTFIGAASSERIAVKAGATAAFGNGAVEGDD
jgi:hypothetical protein